MAARRERLTLPGIKSLSAVSSQQSGYYTDRTGQWTFPKMKERESLVHAKQYIYIYISDYLASRSSQL
jgi:hypothetical protein